MIYLSSLFSQPSQPSVPSNGVSRKTSINRGRAHSVIELAQSDDEIKAKETSLVRLTVAVGLVALAILVLYTFYHIFAFIGAGVTAHKIYEWLNPEPESDMNRRVDGDGDQDALHYDMVHLYGESVYPNINHSQNSPQYSREPLSI